MIGEKSVPEDISLIGIDNTILLCTLTAPSLTSIDIGVNDASKWAFEMLMKRIQNERRPFQKKIIKSKLIKRDSVSKARE